MTSKSFLTNQTSCACGDFRLIYNPVSFPLRINNVTGDEEVFLKEPQNTEFSVVTRLYMKVIRFIESRYGFPSASKDFHLIPSSISLYSSLYNEMDRITNSIQNPDLKTLILCVKELLASSFNTRNLHVDNAIQLISINSLKEQIQDIIRNKNNEVIVKNQAVGQLSISQNFSLAPVYTYYISVYGMPPYQQGFNPLKLSYIADILNSIGIDPYED